jgi:anti-anti-sigma factor
VPPFEILRTDVHGDAHRVVLELRGELDHWTDDDVRVAVDRAVSDGCHEVVLDLSALSFMDSAGLALLHDLRDRSSGATCTMVDGSRAAARLLGRVRGPRILPAAAPARPA